MIAVASQAAPTSKNMAAWLEDPSTAEVSTSTSGHECRLVGTQTAAVVDSVEALVFIVISRSCS